MNKLLYFAGLLIAIVSAGCGSSDIVVTKQMKLIDNKCVNIAPLKSDDPQVGEVLRDAIEKELLRKKIAICPSDTATIFITGSTFLTTRGTASSSGQSIESVSLVGKDSKGEILLSATYNNQDRYTASKLAKEFGAALANKLQ
jgi:hypothetical protein